MSSTAGIFALLGDSEQNVMVQLAQQRTTSLVALGAGLWRTTQTWQSEDLEPLLTYVIDSLCSRGLVQYRLANRYPTREQVPSDIRLTRLGWAVMGYERYVPEIGSPQRHGQAPKHTRDGTNYLNHAFHARGGDIIREDFPTHRRNFPSHIHMYPETDDMAVETKRTDKRAEVLANPTILQDPNGDGSRGYIRVTPDIEARVLAAQHILGPTTGHAEIAERAGMPVRTVKYILTELPRLRRSKGGDEVARSLKERVYAVIKEWDGSRVPDVGELRSILGFADSEHDIVHVLHSLHTQGRIDFDERGSEQGRATYINIRLAKKGGAKTVAPTTKTGLYPSSNLQDDDYMPREEVRSEATEEQAQQLPSAPEPVEEGYPLLDELLEREGKRLESDAKGMAYLTAAAAIEHIDPDAARELVAKANSFDTPFPSPIEREYLRYVADHPLKGDSK